MKKVLPFLLVVLALGLLPERASAFRRRVVNRTVAVNNVVRGVRPSVVVPAPILVAPASGFIEPFPVNGFFLPAPPVTLSTGGFTETTFRRSFVFP